MIYRVTTTDGRTHLVEAFPVSALNRDHEHACKFQLIIGNYVPEDNRPKPIYGLKDIKDWESAE